MRKTTRKRKSSSPTASVLATLGTTPMSKEEFVKKVQESIKKRTLKNSENKPESSTVTLEDEILERVNLAKTTNYYEKEFQDRHPVIYGSIPLKTEDTDVSTRLEVNGKHILTTSVPINKFVGAAIHFLEQMMVTVGSGRYAELELLEDTLETSHTHIRQFVLDITGGDTATAERILSEYAMSLYNGDKPQNLNKFYLGEDQDIIIEGALETGDMYCDLGNGYDLSVPDELYTEESEWLINEDGAVFGTEDGEPILVNNQPVTTDNMEFSINKFCEDLAWGLQELTFAEAANENFTTSLTAPVCYFMLTTIPSFEEYAAKNATLKFKPESYLPFREELVETLSKLLEHSGHIDDIPEEDLHMLVDKACLASVAYIADTEDILP